MYCNNEISSIIDKLSIILSHPVNILKFSFFLLTQTFTESYSSAIDHVLIESFAPLFSFGLLGFGIPFFVFMNQHNQQVKKNIFPSIKTKKESFNVQKILKWQNWYLQKYNMRKSNNKNRTLQTWNYYDNILALYRKFILYKSNLTYEIWNFFSLGHCHLFEFTELYIDLKKNVQLRKKKHK